MREEPVGPASEEPVGRVFHAAVLVISDAGSRGDRKDLSGPAARETLEGWGFQVARVDLVPDEPEVIRARLLEYCDEDRLDLVVTSGGTGFSPRDVTPEATRGILHREAPGVAELLRRETSRHTPFAALSRGVAGIRGITVVLNLPGSPNGVREYLEILRPILPHALKLAGGENPPHVPFPGDPPGTPGPGMTGTGTPGAGSPGAGSLGRGTPGLEGGPEKTGLPDTEGLA